MGQRDLGEPNMPAWRSRMAPWLRRIAAGTLALTLGLGQAFADEIASGYGGGQGRDSSSAFTAAEAFGGDGAAGALSSGRSEAVVAAAEKADWRVAERTAKVTITVDIDEEGIGTDDWTRTVTRTKVTSRFVSSTTRSQSFVIDEDGNRAIAKAVARARAPNNVAAVRNGAGTITAKTSVEVAGNGIASADAGGSIGIAGGGVKVETWGHTSAEVF